MEKSRNLSHVALLLAVIVAVLAVTPKWVHAAGGLHTVVFQYGAKTSVVMVSDGGNAPVPTDTEVPGYTFAGWVGNASNVTEDRTILGAYIKNDAAAVTVTQSAPVQNQSQMAKVNNNVSAPAPSIGGLKQGVPGQTCAVHWYNGYTGQLIRDDLVPYGSTIGAVPDPTCAGYEFSGWEGSWENITEDRSIKAWYFKTYTVSFIDTLTGAAFNVQQVRSGEDANLPEAPHHIGYHFDFVDGDFRNVTSDRKIYIYYGSDYEWHDTPSEWWWTDVDVDRDGKNDEYWWL